MHKIAIVTDSTCDIPLELREKYDIHVVPLYVDWEGEQLGIGKIKAQNAKTRGGGVLPEGLDQGIEGC